VTEHLRILSLQEEGTDKEVFIDVVDAYMFVCMYVCMFMKVYVCMHVCVRIYVCMYTYKDIYIYMYIYIHLLSKEIPMYIQTYQNHEIKNNTQVDIQEDEEWSDDENENEESTMVIETEKN
jgi:hypothetical protein